jgi:hypothetical protein
VTVVRDALVALAVLTQAFILLGVAIPLPGWTIDAPIADFAGVGLIAWAGMQLATGQPLARPPGATAYAGFLVLAVGSALALDPIATHSTAGSALHAVLRGPAFAYAAWAVALPTAVGGMPAERVRGLLVTAIGATAVVSIATSILRIASGEALWFVPIAGLTNNHKTLAVWLAPWAPWLWFHRSDRRIAAVGVAAGFALALSGSKAGALTAVLGLAWAVHADGKPLIARWRPAIAVLAVAIAVAAASAHVSPRLADAAASRASLDHRAAAMWATDPWLGAGPGTSTTWLAPDARDRRINGIDAHGVVQKVGAEHGALGLAAWAVWAALLGVGTALRVDGTRGERWAWAGVVAALMFDLLASTEVFTMTWWIPLGLAWAGLQREQTKRLDPA